MWSYTYGVEGAYLCSWSSGQVTSCTMMSYKLTRAKFQVQRQEKTLSGGAQGNHEKVGTLLLTLDEQAGTRERAKVKFRLGAQGQSTKKYREHE